MAGRNKSRGSRSGRGRSRTDLPNEPTRDPGRVGNIGCWLVALSILIVAGLIALFELVL